MKKLIVLLAISFILFSCKKEEPVTPDNINIDTTNPIITLKGSNDMVIPFNSEWVEPGYVAIDDVDGDITNKVVISGIVNNILAGDCLLTYNVSDAANNYALPVNRNVTVDAACFLMGTYNVVNIYNGVTTNYSDNIIAATDVKNKIYITRFANYTSGMVRLFLDGTNVDLPSQTVKCGLDNINHKFKGSGTFKPSKEIFIIYSDSSSLGIFENCTAIYNVK
jgi:hypothetical protein